MTTFHRFIEDCAALGLLAFLIVLLSVIPAIPFLAVYVVIKVLFF